MLFGIVLGLGCSDTQDQVSDKQVTQNTNKENTNKENTTPNTVAKPESVLARSNVLFIIMDTLRADRLGSCGYKIDLSPNLDKLPSEGVRFENHIANGTKFFPYKNQKHVQEIDESTLNAMKQLGYIDGESC